MLHLRLAQHLSKYGGKLVLLRITSAKKFTWLPPQYIPPPDKKWPEMDPNFKENPERDVVNFPHPEFKLWPSKTRLGFIPDSWFQFFYPKTGVTGPYLFICGMLVFLGQKEILVYDHETKTIPAIIFLIWFLSGVLGPRLAKFTDSLYDEFLDKKRAFKTNDMKSHIDAIEEEKKIQKWNENKHLLFAVKRENVALQLEAAYRRRLQQVQNEVKRRLNYLIEIDDAKKRLQQKHMVNWIVEQVRNSITPQLEKNMLQQCIVDLKAIAQKHQTAT